MTRDAEPMRIPVDATTTVSALLDTPPDARAALVLAHGAGAGMQHTFMADLARALVEHRIAVLRFQFPYMERGSKRPDPPAVAHAAIRAALAEASRALPGLPLFAGGKSFGGRMSSQAQAARPLEGVRGLVFVGFPLHPAKKPSVERAAHLRDVRVPMLFLQGTRDALAEWPLIEETTRRLAPLATLHRIEDADHAFHVPARTGRTDAAVLEEIARVASEWMDSRR